MDPSEARRIRRLIEDRAKEDELTNLRRELDALGFVEPIRSWPNRVQIVAAGVGAGAATLFALTLLVGAMVGAFAENTLFFLLVLVPVAVRFSVLFFELLRIYRISDEIQEILDAPTA